MRKTEKSEKERKKENMMGRIKLGKQVRQIKVQCNLPMSHIINMGCVHGRRNLPEGIAQDGHSFTVNVYFCVLGLTNPRLD